MYLFWLRVAASSLLPVDVSPSSRRCSIEHPSPGGRRAVHLQRASRSSFISSPSLRCLLLAHRWMPAGVREIESLLRISQSPRPILSCLVVLRRCFARHLRARPQHFFWFSSLRSGPIELPFPIAGCARRLAGGAYHRVAAGLRRAVFQFARVCALSPLQERRIKGKRHLGVKQGQDSWWAPLDWLPPLDTLERIAMATLEFGFPCMTVGLIIGSVLAQETSLLARPISSTPK